MTPSTKSPHPLFLFTGKPLLNHATIAWFSFTKNTTESDQTVTLGGVFVNLNSQKCSQHFSFIVFCVENITLTQGFF